MMKKLGIVVMAGLFSLSVAGLSFADEMKGMKHDAPPAATGAPANPCDPSKGKDKGKEKKAEKAAKKKDDKKSETPAASPLTPAEKK